ncbi:OprO/OprP family phosphate-selective porin [Thalassotalea euphylliae]|nr:porin [Thalassotalea euphylliae]
MFLLSKIPGKIAPGPLILSMTTIVSSILLTSPSVFANQLAEESTSFLQLIKTLKDNNTISESQYQALKQQAEHQAEDAAELIDDSDENALAIATQGGLEVSTFDGRYAFEISGRLMYDLTAFDEDNVELGNDSSIRRAYLGVEGKVDYDWGYKLTLDFADGDVDIKDAYLSYQGQTGWLWKLGHAKEPFSLAEQTSSKYITFLERPLATEFAPGRSLGIHANTYGNQWTFAASLTAETWDEDPDDEGDEGWGATTRATYAPWHSDTQALHFGAAMSYRQTSDDNSVKFDIRPETKNTDIKYLNTGKIKQANNINRYGIEAAWVEGPFSVQSEYILTEVDGDFGSNLAFSGWYITSSWMLTGESRNYKFKKGAFGRIKPYAPGGAWELAIRHSALDLNDQDVTGGDSSITTLGVNWYINDRIRTMLNYAMVNNDETADDNGDVQPSDGPNYFQLRLQMDF